MKEQVLVSLETKTIKKLDKTRNIFPRSAYIRRLIENDLNTVNGTVCQDATVHGVIWRCNKCYEAYTRGKVPITDSISAIPI